MVLQIIIFEGPIFLEHFLKAETCDSCNACVFTWLKNKHKKIGNQCSFIEEN